jgi:hypothetical protein
MNEKAFLTLAIDNLPADVQMIRPLKLYELIQESGPIK